MRRLKVCFRQTQEILRSHWLRLISAILLILASSNVVLAKADARAGSDCYRILASCELALNMRANIEKEVENVDKLETVVVTQKVSYVVAFWGTLKTDTNTNEFIDQAAATLADARGWIKAGYDFRRVDTGGSFTLVLSEPQILNTIPGCDSNWSCRSGRNVIINEDRWREASAAWNAAGGSLRDYRHMVINHETGHWLGHGHYGCSNGVNNVAPVMQQQSIDLQGCKFNPWPLQFEVDAL